MQANEIITLILAMAVWAFLIISRDKIRKLPAWKTFIASFVVLSAGWIATLAEGLFWHEALNLIEHICYAVSSILLAVWCWRIFTRSSEAAE